ncbi:MAG: hypothetical protein KA099_13215 [Alphaproteobacteria bacterium]|nr:hypothetical protein [Alphaproteobacteria bacterium]MBP7758100.1 hypothetical protein [Alphaproteobacteria bacterium]MBP7761467.1 hypothetical protein [Alphaproteobacteria bacterium]MBP7906270.1 hypothetical protein [Alphaproteobacteria bacterium]
MSNISQHKARTQQIIEEMGNGDESISYESASFQIEEANSELLAQHVVDTPDEVIDQVFEAFAAMQVRASELGNVTPVEGIRLIGERAKDMFENYRGWEAVEKAVRPHQDKLEKLIEETEGPEHSLA